MNIRLEQEKDYLKVENLVRIPFGTYIAQGLSNTISSTI